MISKTSKIFIAGHRGMVGSAIVRRLQSAGYTNLITRTRQELDLLDQRAIPRHCEERSDAAIHQAPGSPRACGPRDDDNTRQFAERPLSVIARSLATRQSSSLANHYTNRRLPSADFLNNAARQ